MSAEGLSKRSHEPVDTSTAPDDGYTKELKPPSAPHMKGMKSLVIAISVPLILGVLDSFFFSPNQTFYKELKKPFWNPPGWLFGFAWSLLYPTMGLASWLVWVEGGWRRQTFALSLYAVQLTLNLLWPAIFFGYHKLGFALADIVALWVVLIACIITFAPINHVAANLFKPYLAWVTFATALNYSLWKMNQDMEPLVPAEQ